MTAERARKIQVASAAICLAVGACGSQADDRPTMAGVLEASTDEDWRAPDPEFTLYMAIPGGEVIMELALKFAPNVIENIRSLTKSAYFDGTAITRSQDNYVVQWGDPNAGSEGAKPYGDASDTVKAEFYRDGGDSGFVRIDSRDAYADEVGFENGFPVGRDSGGKREWLTHCFGMLGVGRDSDPDSGNGSQLYVVTGHAPRHLDRNVVLVGRVIRGMELLTTLPRGTGPLGFYEREEQLVPISWMRLAADMPQDDRVALQIMKTDTETFRRLVESRRHRAEEWFVDPTDKIELCNVPIPVRTIK